jgi:hypothetical protein
MKASAEGGRDELEPPTASRPLLVSWVRARASGLGLATWIFAAEASQYLPPSTGVEKEISGRFPNESVGEMWLGLGPKL